ncbi:lanC-like protein 2 [Onthophagus taurus]|uniref:lanC-like protein 2 n=1 Tax=Onthophagus taurus TaxID=166361 RepID=UPI000C202608|nr:lanC-like protein 2 [Onthophagus taurus]
MAKIIERHFENPFPEYSEDSAKNVISNKTIDKLNKVVTGLDEKWETCMRQLSQCQSHDYTVYTGTSGIAMLRFLKDPDDKANLLEVKRLLMLNNLKKKRLTFLCGDAGPLALGAVVSYKLGDVVFSRSLIEELAELQKAVINYKADLPNEYMYGRAGYLYAILYINKHISPPPIDDYLIRKVVEAIFNAGQVESRNNMCNQPLLYKWHDSYYLGAAHGMSGIMYLLLQARNYVRESELNDLIKPTIDYLTSKKFASGNFPSSLGSQSDKYIQWCHGAPGFVFMYSEAYKVFGDQKYLQMALKSAEVVWNRGLITKGYSLCHGVSGNAYCFLEMYQTTKDLKHLYRAIKFAEWCIDYTKEHEEHEPDRPLSLFEGIAGPMYLLVDIQKPMHAKFPGFTL